MSCVTGSPECETKCVMSFQAYYHILKKYWFHANSGIPRMNYICPQCFYGKEYIQNLVTANSDSAYTILIQPQDKHGE